MSGGTLTLKRALMERTAAHIPASSTLLEYDKQIAYSQLWCQDVGGGFLCTLHLRMLKFLLLF